MTLGKSLFYIYHRIPEQFFNNLPYRTFLIERIIKINSLRINNYPRIAIEFFQIKE